MHKDIGRPLFFIILALLFVGGLGTMMYRNLFPLYLILVIIGVPVIVLTALSSLFTPKATTTTSTQIVPGQKIRPSLVIIIIVIVICSVFYSIIK